MMVHLAGTNLVRVLAASALVGVIQTTTPATPPARPAETSPPAAEPASKAVPEPTYDSAQKVGEAFVAATTKKEWKTAFHCFAPEARDLVIVQLITMFQLAVAKSSDGQPEFEAVLTEHAFDAEAAFSAARKEADAAGTDRKSTDWHRFVTTYLSAVKDKEALFVDLLTWADKHHANASPVDPKPVSLDELKPVGDTATARLSQGQGNSDKEGWTVTFKATAGDWRLTLPERQFPASGWNDGFLFGYLDAIHQWRF